MRVGSIALLMALVFSGSAQAAPQRVLYVGDSLGVGTTPLLQRELGSAARISGDSRIGRPSPEGLRVLSQRVSPADEVVIFDLGTNDDPANPGLLANDLNQARRASGDSCMVVATLNRPPLNGVPVDGLNQAVLAFASANDNVQLVDWNAIVASEPGLLGSDRVHPTPQGYALRAQLFAQAVAECAAPSVSADDLTPTPAPTKKPKQRRKPRPRIKVPGIESSGISFTEPVRFRGLTGTLLLPNTKPPYPAVVMLGGSQTAAEFFAAHGIATLTYHERGSTADAKAAVELLRQRKEVRAVGVWAFGSAAERAAAAADRKVDAVAVLSPRVVARASDPTVAKWLQVKDDSDDPAAPWRAVRQPVLAIWGTKDERSPIRANAAALRSALAEANDDRTFRWFEAGHGGAVTYKDGAPVYAPGLLEETARWLGLHLGAKRAQAAISDALPPANGDQGTAVANASALMSVPLQLLWLLAPLGVLGIAAIRSRAAVDRADASPRAGRLAALAIVCALGALAAIAVGVALVLDSGSVAEVAGRAWPFALAFALAAIAAIATVGLVRRRAFLAAAACSIWIALALFWLL